MPAGWGRVTRLEADLAGGVRAMGDSVGHWSDLVRLGDTHNYAGESHGLKRRDVGDHVMNFQAVWQQSEQRGCLDQGSPHVAQGGARGLVGVHRVHRNQQAVC